MSLRLIFGLLAMAVACSTTCAQEAASSGSAGAGSSDYVLQPLDLIRVQIFQEEDLTREVRISREYTVTLPLVGAVDLKGMSVRQAQDQIRERYDREFLVNPQLNIIVLEYSKRTVNVLGSVSSPGVIEFPREQGLTLLDAISHAGGFIRLADRKRVRLTRTKADGQSENFIINVDDIIQGNKVESWPLQKDDIIYVPERLL